MSIGRLARACQTGRHSNAARGFDLYETPPIAVEELLAVENLPHWIWEPCAGRGAIANALRDRGHAVVCSDLVRYDDFPLHFVDDFLLQTKAPVGCDAQLNQLRAWQQQQSPLPSLGPLTAIRRDRFRGQLPSVFGDAAGSAKANRGDLQGWLQSRHSL